MELLDQSGQLIFAKEIWIEKKPVYWRFNYRSVAGGNYFLRIINQHIQVKAIQKK